MPSAANVKIKINHTHDSLSKQIPVLLDPMGQGLVWSNFRQHWVSSSDLSNYKSIVEVCLGFYWHCSSLAYEIQPRTIVQLVEWGFSLTNAQFSY